MKSASKFEKIAARCWNLLNEGKPFTPIFITGTLILFNFDSLFNRQEAVSFGIAFLVIVPLLVIFYLYDFPLFLRNYLWLPLVAFTFLWQNTNLPLLLFAVCLYFFFTVFFWGTLYYHLRIGTSWLNFTRFWKLVLKNSDSTSGNAQEQLPKVMLILSVWNMVFQNHQSGDHLPLMEIGYFYVGLLVFTLILHHFLFDWKPIPYKEFTNGPKISPKGISNRVVVIVVDGMRKERFYEANTPFLDKLKENGTEYLNMETVYPARTVVCFTSMFSGTYSFEHGIKSNMVWKTGMRVESIFDSLRKVGKKGRLLAVAHLVDSMGDDVDTFTAVMHNDKADPVIMEHARRIMKEQDPELMVIQMIATDQTGHSRGVLYDEYIQKIEEADKLIEQFVEHLEIEEKMDDTTLIICADHGQADGIGGHGHLDEGERYVPFFMHGPAIEKGKKIQEKQSLVSLAPTIAYLLGAPYPSHSRGRVLTEAIIDKKEEKEIETTENHRFPASL
ncbi:alkaline phosphatase family protein [Bacillus massilinigeriensis]|uniref:alkaline phosphatase family protein n=1 Tax=Bacillus mediterraneensis TaxID=1805474 RepID=UPI0008F84E1F|nr:alkaline phosphatase family protein [Bacillus mediterraneensis]